ncbi:uncharacterized protein LOC131994777 [Stomoxys calcitrans]|uniref:uncharacterized protein LOC131994777 n=1 Tax=Stomoxys calcitrans TaxID=35570 RepID=UPI0027E28AED|nr:uncharacterized protein LOC131994777 [Stomoxys calcitrans]
MESAEVTQINITTTKNNKTTIIPIYRPPNKKVKTFLQELEKLLYGINRQNKLIITGDVNIDIKKNNNTTSNYLNILSSYGLQCMINEVTREDNSNQSMTCIDHLFARWDKQFVQAYAAIIRIDISDHFAIFGSVDETKSSLNHTQDRQTNETSTINISKVNQQINDTDWERIIISSNNTNELFNNIYKTFNDIYTNSTSQQTKHKKRNPHPWLNEHILKCSKNDYYYRQFLINRNNIRGTWQIINKITGKKTENLNDTIKRNFKDESLKDITENFALKFNENVLKIVHSCSITTLNANAECIINNSLYIEYATEEEINNILKTLNIRKSAGIDNIQAVDLKNHANLLTPIITKLINGSISESSILNIMKQSIIRLIFKSGEKTDYNNYRPIAILPVVEKVLEEIIVRRLNSFLKKYNIINKQQYGFQKGKNIKQLLGYFANHINESLDQNNNCLALFIDFSKAFDTLPHDKLIEMLERSGIRGLTLRWFADNLSSRSFSVKISNTSSSMLNAPYGVPQCSKLGPILYIIYSNEMVRQLKNSTAFTYADDTAIVVCNKSLNTAIKTLQNELDIITRWCYDSGLIINSSKTKVMHIRPKSIPKSNIHIIYHDTECLHKNCNAVSLHDKCNGKCSTELELVETYKYLGVHLDDGFKWKEIYCITVVREFMDDGSLAKKINHNQNTRRKIEGKYMVPKFKNDYGKYSLSVTLPTIINEIPTNITKERNYNIRTKLIKEYYLNN